MDVVIRDALAPDADQMTRWWGISLRKDNPNYFFQTWESFYEQQDHLIELILSRDTVFSLVACSPEDPSLMLGFLVFELDSNGKKFIHYIFVERGFRKLGIAKLLLAKAEIDLERPIVVTHVTNLLKKAPKRFRFTHSPERLTNDQ